MILFKTNDSPNTINKTLLDPLNVPVNWRGYTDILNPVVLLLALSGEEYNQYNYAYIQSFARYYFINSVEIERGNVWKLDLAVDVLETYKQDILNSTAKFNRKVEVGDYLNVTIDSNVKSSVTRFTSNNTFTGTGTMILSAIG